jgi:hypothetical protein
VTVATPARPNPDLLALPGHDADGAVVLEGHETGLVDLLEPVLTKGGHEVVII